MKQLAVNELFGPTIQGEGPSAGSPTLFLRLVGCNLNCDWCDTKYTWDFKNFDRQKEVQLMDVDAVYRRLIVLGGKVTRIVITGGEPLLQVEALDELIRYIDSHSMGTQYYYEVETNGTLFPASAFLRRVHQINCSPKLSNSGVLFSRRINLAALTELNRLDANFKFVVDNNEASMDEVLTLVNQCGLRKVYLMPEGKTREEQIKASPRVIEYCVKYGFNFSPRLHVWVWDQTRGV